MKKGSPYYAAAVGRFGRYVLPEAAVRIARQHGNTLEDLGVKARKDGRVDLLTVILELGY